MQKATIYANWPDGTNCVFPYMPGEPESMEDRIEYVRTFTANGRDIGFIPAAWSADTGKSIFFSDEDREASIAAGRVIEKVDGKYVARGVEPVAWRPENDLLKAALDKLEAGYAAQSKTPTLDKLANTAEPNRPALTWNAKTEADRFPGFTVTRSNADAPIYTGSFPTSDTASHQVTPKFGSSDLA